MPAEHPDDRPRLCLPSPAGPEPCRLQQWTLRGQNAAVRHPDCAADLGNPPDRRPPSGSDGRRLAWRDASKSLTLLACGDEVGRGDGGTGTAGQDDFRHW